MKSLVNEVEASRNEALERALNVLNCGEIYSHYKVGRMEIECYRFAGKEYIITFAHTSVIAVECVGHYLFVV